MKIFKKLLIFSFIIIGFLAFSPNAFATVPTLYISGSGGDSVNISVTGDVNSSVVLYYNLNYSSQTRVLGNTNNAGYFSATVSTSSYGVTPGSSVYILINGQQSSSYVWPYSMYSSSTLSLSQTSVSLSVGQTSNVTVYNTSYYNYSYIYNSYYVSNNSNQSVATAYVSGNSVSIYGSTNGNTTITICQTGNSSSCGTIYVTITGYYNNNTNYYGTGYNYGNYGFNISALSLAKGSSITISSATSVGLYASENSNPSVVSVTYSSAISGCTGTSLYSTVTGQLCGNTTYNSGVYVSGCSAGSIYSSTTGQLCSNANYYNSSYYSSYIPGCTGTSLYSITTGQSCYNNNFNNNYYNAYYPIGNNNASVTITGLSTGSSTLTFCQNSNNSNCTTVYVTVL